jgi:hypothetical protein
MKNRIAGILWLIVIIAGGWSFMVPLTMIVRGDAAATAANILASEHSYRLAFVANLIAGACYMGVTVILYELVKPVDRTLSMLAAFFGVAGVAAGAAAAVTHFAPLVLLGPSKYAAAFTASQLQALTYMSLRLQAEIANAGMVFFGLQCLAAGYLIARSTFMPRILGVLLSLGGLGYVTASCVTFLAPDLGALIAPFILPAGFVGEGSLCVWLIVTGASRTTAVDAAARPARSPEPRAGLA